ncbi:MAG: hypothetical protein E7621_06825 [Ruminococcaceae bacterium]|nr:hypothetical protein [Oscillospiraceae bacterium]
MNTYEHCGLVEAIRYKCDDVFLFIFADEYNFIITMSKYDLFEETKTDILEAEATLEIQKNI